MSQLEATKDGRKRGEINQRLKPLVKKAADFAKLNDLYGKLKNQSGKIHFRVYMVIDENRHVPLVTSLAPEE